MRQAIISIEETSKQSKDCYKELRNNPICPICGKGFRSVSRLSCHFSLMHMECGNFKQWFTDRFPNYCKKCGKRIEGSLHDVYKVSFCSLSCKQAKEFRTDKQMLLISNLGKLMSIKNKGTKHPNMKRVFTEEGRKRISEKVSQRLLIYNHAKGKVFTSEIRQRMSEGHRKSAATSWKGNFTRFQKIVRAELFWVWTKPILENDGYKCQRCNIGRELSVHHIVPFKVLIHAVLFLHPELDLMLYEDKWKLQEACLSYPPLLDLSNGITLCKPCHREADHFLLAA